MVEKTHSSHCINKCHFSDIFEQINRNAITRRVTSLTLMQSSAGTDDPGQRFTEDSAKAHKQNVIFPKVDGEQNAFSKRTTVTVLRILYQREKSEICLLCGIIHQVLPWPTAGRTPAQTGRILEIADTWQSFPKYHTSLLTGLRFSFTGSLLKPEPIPKRAKFNATNRNAVDFHHFCGCSWWSVLNFFPSDFLGTFILRRSLGEASLLGEEKRAREKPLAQWERIQADYLLHQVWGRTKEEENAKAFFFLPRRALF